MGVSLCKNCNSEYRQQCSFCLNNVMLQASFFEASSVGEYHYNQLADVGSIQEDFSHIHHVSAALPLIMLAKTVALFPLSTAWEGLLTYT